MSSGVFMNRDIRHMSDKYSIKVEGGKSAYRIAGSPYFVWITTYYWGIPGGSEGKNLACNARDSGPK